MKKSGKIYIYIDPLTMIYLSIKKRSCHINQSVLTSNEHMSVHLFPVVGGCNASVISQLQCCNLMRSIKHKTCNSRQPPISILRNNVMLEKEVALKFINEKPLSVCETSTAFNANYEVNYRANLFMFIFPCNLIPKIILPKGKRQFMNFNSTN
jgi:hypothetical protein